MPPIDPEPNEEERLQKLDQDFDKPFSPPDDIQKGADPSTTHPATDTNTDDTQTYNEGPTGGGEINEPEDTNLEPGDRIA